MRIDRQFNIPPGYFQAFDFPLSGNPLQIIGDFSVPVWIMGITPHDFSESMAGRAYNVLDARSGFHFNYRFTPAWRHYAKLVAWNTSANIPTVGQLSVARVGGLELFSNTGGKL